MKGKKSINLNWCIVIVKLLPILFKASPILFLGSCLISVLNSAFFVFETIAMQKLVDGAAFYMEGIIATTEVLIIAVVFGIVKILQRIVNGSSNYMAEYQGYFYEGKLQAMLNWKCSRIEPIQYERSEFLNDLEKSSQGMKSCVSLISVTLLIFTFSVPYIIFVSIYLYSINPILVFSVLLIFLPLLFNHLFISKIYSQLEDKVAPLRREMNHYENCICDKRFFKETRMLGIYSYFKKKYSCVLKRMTEFDLQVKKRTCRRNVLSKVITMLGYFSVLGLLVFGTLKGDISVGSLAAVFASLSTLIGLLEELIERHIGSLTQNIGTIKNFLNFLEYPESEHASERNLCNGDIVLEHVYFQYPNSNQYALKDISLKIRRNETVAIVGVNGSGKTTLVKLLMRIYAPTSGVITCKNKKQLQDNDQRGVKGISAVFQDYKKYPFTLEKNVFVSDMQKQLNSTDVINDLQEAGIEVESNTFPEGVQTVLSKEFDGVDVSIGQWQRIAIARGYYRENLLIFLDEPTAAIDPLEENRIYDAFKKCSRDRTTVIVTHRLGAAQIADRIVVLNNGVIDSIGTHDELLNESGLYKEIFMSQSQWYYERDCDEEEKVDFIHFQKTV